MEIYTPQIIEEPELAIQPKESAWLDIPTILKDIILRFDITPKLALEFGVEYGYSTSALANYFDDVIGVDTFEGDEHSGVKKNHYDETKMYLSKWNNISLLKMDFRDYILDNNNLYDLIHIDIVHEYFETFECGEWAVNHSKVTIFHDTISHPEIKYVCLDLSEQYNLEFYNYPKSNGLGILVNNYLKL